MLKIVFKEADFVICAMTQVEHTSHHGAKFRGDRPTKLGDMATRQK